MRINLKTKIWLTICFIVLMFSFFTLFYFPRQQGNLLISDYNTEVQNLANTVALGVNIALTEQNFEGVQTAIEYVKNDPRLQFVSMVQFDTSWNTSHTAFVIKKTIFKTFPEKEHPTPGMLSTDSVIVKNALFTTNVMSGAILLGFNTEEITESKEKIKIASIIVSSIIFMIGILIGFVLARNISVPVLALRDAANRVGEGDLDQKVKHIPNDEIGDLGKAFNKMVTDLSTTRKELNEKNVQLSSTVSTLNHTLLELKNTHAQLIQSEKMASLGELTAGIAHEIQNPLNFVNNFSEVNKELLIEMQEEIDKGNMNEVKSIAKDVIENEEKINHHGKRADAIVKGMLQHSRKSSGQKEPTNINTLADEFLRLSYQGLRAKDKSFNVTMKTDFDMSIGKINIIPQDIGRVLLNLYNNAFYAVQQRQKELSKEVTPFEKASPLHEPTVSVTTKKPGNSVIITVSDNGNGIPQNIIDKIFQPFFTTKPTGEGTGLGLSLSYDIIKAHGGEIKVESKEGEFTEFVVLLPAS
ncbi:MAG: ATP-binding protein [Ginsengibacter sp.]